MFEVFWWLENFYAAQYRLIFFFICTPKKFGNLKNPDAQKNSGESFSRMLENISGSL
jgi:hypothetical protein